MEFERITNKNHALFDRAFALYESAFPTEERRDEYEQARALSKNDYHFEVIIDDGCFIGIILYWELENLIFLEHFATLPEIRGKGHGARALDVLKAKGKTILLEIEPPNDEMTTRRFRFYQRNGFYMNSFYHVQAKYHLGDEDFELKVMSYPKLLSNEEYRCFYEYMTREIGIQANKAQNVEIRALGEKDDLRQVAKLIYLTDPYIYPNWFDDIEDGIRVLVEMIKLPTLYSKENILVATTQEGFIAGIIVSKQTPFMERFENIVLAFQRAGIPCDERTKEVFETYYAKMGEKEDEYYIANVAVDPLYQRRGIAAAMLERVLEKEKACSLECVINNAGSVRLYQRLGFKIAYEYPGVHGVPCYKMYYRR